MLYTRMMPCFSIFGAVAVSGDYWTLAPYTGVSHLWGEFWGAFGGGLLEAFQGFSDGVGHGDVDVVFWVVPIDGQSTVLASRWVDGDGVMFSERIEEVGGIVGGKKFDTKVVYSKGEVVGRLEWVQKSHSR